jgi:hypothetical protein
MKRIHRVALAVPLALLAGVATAAGQARAPEVLNLIELRQLVASAEPGDHARLGAHFAALAEQYTAEAARHTAMSKAFSGNPSRSGAVAAGAHCTRLARLNTESAATLRELAAHHGRLAMGAPSTVPEGSARFVHGEGAPAPTDAELAALAARARTPADHRALTEYFLTVAAHHTTEAEAHGRMAQAYRGTANRRGGDFAAHCDRLVKLSRDAAAEARAAAAEHKDLANVG